MSRPAPLSAVVTIVHCTSASPIDHPASIKDKEDQTERAIITFLYIPRHLSRNLTGYNSRIETPVLYYYNKIHCA